MTAKNKIILMIRERNQAVGFIAELDIQVPVVFAPMVRIVPLHADQVLANATGIIFTSANAVRFYAQTVENRDVQVFCVGSQTERAAKTVGFNVAQRFETTARLVAHFNMMSKPVSGFLYPRAKTVSLDIVKELSKAGHQIHDAILYRQTFQLLSDEAKDLIESSNLVVPIFSQEIAKRFREGLMSTKPRNLTLMCISAHVAVIFDDLDGFHVETAQKPTRAAMIDCLKAHLMA